jgi:SET domain-containing protein
LCMIKDFNSNRWLIIKTKILKDPVKGRGVYADEDIKKSSLIEECHLLLIDYDEISEGLEGYVYEFSKRKAAVALGNGSLYNHSSQPNAAFYFNYSKKILYIEALKDIKWGEEITISYGYSKSDRDKFHIV